MLTSELLDRDRVRFQQAATFLLARIANMSEESIRGDVADALFAAWRTRQKRSITRSDVVLLIKPVETSGLVARVARVSRRSC